MVNVGTPRENMRANIMARVMDYAEAYDEGGGPKPQRALQDILGEVYKCASLEAAQFKDPHSDVNIPAAAAYWLREMLEEER